MSRCASRQVAAMAVVMLCNPFCGWWSLARASDIEYSAFDQIAMSYEVPITNASDHLTLPSVILVTSATLDTNQPSDRAIHAPKGMIYLSLQATSGPVQVNYKDANSGHFFAGMTPLPASALSYVLLHRAHHESHWHPCHRTMPNDRGRILGLYGRCGHTNERRWTNEDCGQVSQATDRYSSHAHNNHCATRHRLRQGRQLDWDFVRRSAGALHLRPTSS
jgi:hypothetical protein